MNVTSIQQMTERALETLIQQALLEAQDRPNMKVFLRTLLGDVLHEIKIEEIASNPMTRHLLGEIHATQ